MREAKQCLNPQSNSVLPLVTVPIVSPSLVFEALVMLLRFDFVKQLRGFAGIHRRISSRQIDPHLHGSTECIDEVVKAVARASGYYLLVAACLQRSAAITWMLQRRGIPAQLVIGISQFPFKSHAWVEVEDRVVNDGQRIRERYIVLDRIGGLTK